jgi:type II secretory pathway component PulK
MENQKLYYESHRENRLGWQKEYNITHRKERQAYASKPENLARTKAIRGTPERRKRQCEQAKASHVRYPEKRKARQILNNAIRAGRIQRQPCVDCNSTVRVQGHHTDYSKPLEVVWLCGSCHGKRHWKDT